MNTKTRTIARTNLYKLVFEFLFSGGETNLKTFTLLSSPEFSEEDLLYMKTAYFGIVEKFDELSKIIQDFAQGFNIERIYKTDLAALLVAIYEMLYIDEIPINVSISEAVCLVKIYSTEKSSSYVNGILSSINKTLLNNK